jgi:hypothetical protein
VEVVVDSTTQNQLDPTVRPFVEYGLGEAKNLYKLQVHNTMVAKLIYHHLHKHKLHYRLLKIVHYLAIHYCLLHNNNSKM